MERPLFDASGYPAESTLEEIRTWDCVGNDKLNALVEFCRAAWTYPEHWRVRSNGVHRIATGGWSGNEDIIGAMQENFIFWSMCWQLSARGGLYILKIPNLK